MLILTKTADIASLPPGELRRLIQNSVGQLLGQFEPGEFTLEQLCRYLVIVPGEGIEAIDEALEISILDAKHALVFEHINWFEMVIVISDEGFGFTLFLPKQGIDSRLLAMCKALTMKCT